MTDLDDLRAELDELAQPEKKKGLSAREERIIAGFEGVMVISGVWKQAEGVAYPVG